MRLTNSAFPLPVGPKGGSVGLDAASIWGILAKMNETRILVERAEDGRIIDIRDRHTGLLFSFPISDRKLGPLMYTTVFGPGLPIQNPPDETSQKQARSFADDKARKRGWIDQL
jgi:hypothetical protein